MPKYIHLKKSRSNGSNKAEKQMFQTKTVIKDKL